MKKTISSSKAVPRENLQSQKMKKKACVLASKIFFES